MKDDPFKPNIKPRAERLLTRRKNRHRQPRPAPGHLRIVQSFLNTRDLKAGTDELATPYDLDTWLASQGLLSSGVKVTEEDLHRALDVRQGLHAIARSHSGAKLDRSAARRLDAASRGARIEVRFDDEGDLRFEAASPSVGDAIGRLLGMVAEARFSEDWPRLKTCGNRNCQAAFYDKQRTGKWCSHRCGDLMRAKAYYRGKKKSEGFV